MNAIELIAKKRDGGEHSADEIGWLVDQVTRGAIPDYQVSAWLMAVFIRGMSKAETAALTLAMAHSGQVLDLSEVKRAMSSSGSTTAETLIADKHSTGGVGDKTTITVAPLVAACGVPLGKMSGRGLGHTGGTLDKLDSIPGYRVELTTEEFVDQVREVGVAI